MDDAHLALHTVPEIAEMVKISAKQVRSSIRQGELPTLKFGREYRIRDDDLQAWLEAHRTTSARRELGATR